MEFTPTTAAELCQQIVLDLSDWPSLEAALQEGGFEQKSAGRIEAVIEAWIHRSDLLVLRDVKVPGIDRARMDIVLADKHSVGNPLLSIDSIFELKTNYAGQSSAIRSRLAPAGKNSAIAQVIGYKSNGLIPGKKDAYVLYTITQLPFPTIPNIHPRSPGWSNGTTPLANGIATLRAAAGPKLLGESTGAYVYCALIKA